MRVSRSVLAFLAAALLLLATALPAVATRGQPDQQLPFHMSIRGVDLPLEMAPGVPPFLERITFDGRCSVPSDWITTIDSSGTAAHLGQVAVVNSHCTRFDFFGSPPTGEFGDGQMVVTAANGDQLWIAYWGSFVFYPAGRPDVGTSVITMTITIVGGTGRFEGASGSGTGNAVDNFPAGPNVASFNGHIVYDASNRANQ